MLTFLAAVPASARAQDAHPEQAPWAFRTRAVLAGDSDQSEPEGYHVYSPITLEAALTRHVARHFALELAIRTESRELDGPPGIEAQDYTRLGSLELLPVTLTFQWRPFAAGTVHPYVGVGGTLTVTWEKSGDLDTTDVPPYVGPALQLGLDVDLGPRALLNLDVRLNMYTLEVQGDDGSPLFEIDVHPLNLGLGVGFRF